MRVCDGDSVYEALPASALELDVTIDFPHPLIGKQRGRYRVTAQSVYRVQAELERPDGAVRRSGPGCVRLTRPVG